jgi:ABC-2 type transport system ATP-binding protein
VEAACTRAIIIDRGQIVANGTPLELKQRAAGAGAVTLQLRDAAAASVTAQLGALQAARDSMVLHQDGGGALAVRVFPRAGAPAGELAAAVAELARQQSWKLEELHTEEGRLDDVFRSVTLSDRGTEVRP